jgi:hypothetical protein
MPEPADVPANLEYIIEAWKKSIDVQQHFNEICMKIRNFYISLVSALIALIGASFCLASPNRISKSGIIR